jgi:hypothetical protein
MISSQILLAEKIGNAIALYDVKPHSRYVMADENDEVIECIDTGAHRVTVPLRAGISNHDTYCDAMSVHLLCQAAHSNPIFVIGPNGKGYDKLLQHFVCLDVDLNQFMQPMTGELFKTSNLPNGFYLALPPPEYLGRITIDDQERIAIFVFNCDAVIPTLVY